jgi:taspase (threonine aspartase 1)
MIANYIWQAIGSMSSNQEKPVCVMSRGTRGNIMQGGARVRF